MSEVDKILFVIYVCNVHNIISKVAFQLFMCQCYILVVLLYRCLNADGECSDVGLNNAW